MFPHLNGWRANIEKYQEIANKELLSLLEKCDGNIAIVWDDTLSGPVGLIAKYTSLKERNVVKMLPLRPGRFPDIDVKSVIFIVRPNLKLMDYVADNILSEDKKQKLVRKDFYLYFLPKRSLLCEKHLKLKGVYGSFQYIDEFKCPFFPIDNDLISMELDDVYRKLHIEGDPTCLYQAAEGLITLQNIYGRITRIYGKGENAKNVWELTKDMTSDERNTSMEKGAIDQLFLIDRSVDLMSPLITQLTYEGLIDENFGINQTTAHFPGERFNKGDEAFDGDLSSSEKKSVILNSGEKLYAELRDKNFNAIGQILSKHARSISNQLDERHGDKTVQDMKNFVERLPHMLANKQALATHTTIAEIIKEITDSFSFMDELQCEQEFMICADLDRPNQFIEDMIARKGKLETVLRLMCIQCVASSGLKPKILDYYKREIVQVYGIETLQTIENLERAGLLKVQSGNRSYAVLRKALNLTVDDANEIAPKDISFVHSFYAPLSIRIVEQMLKPLGWQALNDSLTCLPGPAFDDFQYPINNITGRRGSLSSEISQNDTPKVILIFFIGGCTFAEVAALRFLAQQDEHNVEFIIATTKIINKNSFLKNFIEVIN